MSYTFTPPATISVPVVGKAERLAEHLNEPLNEHSVVRPVFLQQVHGTDVVALHADTPDGTAADACWSLSLIHISEPTRPY